MNALGKTVLLQGDQIEFTTGEGAPKSYLFTQDPSPEVAIEQATETPTPSPTAQPTTTPIPFLNRYRNVSAHRSPLTHTNSCLGYTNSFAHPQSFNYRGRVTPSSLRRAHRADRPLHPLPFLESGVEKGRS